MNPLALDTIDAAVDPRVRSGAAVGGRRSGESFEGVLAQAAGVGDREAARAAATKLVSSTFIVPVLSALHDTSFAAPPFAASFAERQFQPMLDQAIADRIAAGAGFPLVDVIVNRLLGPEGGASER